MHGSEGGESGSTGLPYPYRKCSNTFHALASVATKCSYLRQKVDVLKLRTDRHRRLHALASVASAPVKAVELSGESPDRGRRYRPASEGNCVFNRKGGEQLEENEQSVTKVNSIRPSLSGSVLVTREPLTS
jgi:hypothetical protein